MHGDPYGWEFCTASAYRNLRREHRSGRRPQDNPSIPFPPLYASFILFSLFLLTFSLVLSRGIDREALSCLFAFYLTTETWPKVDQLSRYCFIPLFPFQYLQRAEHRVIIVFFFPPFLESFVSSVPSRATLWRLRVTRFTILVFIFEEMIEKALGFLVVFLELTFVSRKLSLINHRDRSYDRIWSIWIYRICILITWKTKGKKEILNREQSRIEQNGAESGLSRVSGKFQADDKLQVTRAQCRGDCPSCRRWVLDCTDVTADAMSRRQRDTRSATELRSETVSFDRLRIPCHLSLFFLSFCIEYLRTFI